MPLVHTGIHCGSCLVLGLKSTTLASVVSLIKNARLSQVYHSFLSANSCVLFKDMGKISSNSCHPKATRVPLDPLCSLLYFMAPLTWEYHDTVMRPPWVVPDRKWERGQMLILPGSPPRPPVESTQGSFSEIFKHVQLYRTPLSSFFSPQKVYHLCFVLFLFVCLCWIQVSQLWQNFLNILYTLKTLCYVTNVCYRTIQEHFLCVWSWYWRSASALLTEGSHTSTSCISIEKQAASNLGRLKRSKIVELRNKSITDKTRL